MCYATSSQHVWLSINGKCVFETRDKTVWFYLLIKLNFKVIGQGHTSAGVYPDSLENWVRGYENNKGMNSNSVHLIGSKLG